MPDRLLAPLLALMRLRRVGVIEARRDLVARLDAQNVAEQALVGIEHRMAHEAGIAAAVTGSDAMVEACGRWLGPARREAATAGADRDRAFAETNIARARLAALRAAVEAVRGVVDKREEAIEVQAARHEQALIDELTRSRRLPGPDAGR